MSSICASMMRIASALLVVAIGSTAVAGAATPAGPQLTVSGLQTDALIAPLGLSDLTPKLSWTDTSSVNGAVQKGYEVQAADSLSDLTGGRLLWDSGQVQSPPSMRSTAARHSHRGSSVTWQVRVWDGSGAVSAWSAPAVFQIGLTKAGDWTAQWITNPSWTNAAAIPAMPLFAKQFPTKTGIVSAMLYISGIGIVAPSIMASTLEAPCWLPAIAPSRRTWPTQPST